MTDLLQHDLSLLSPPRISQALFVRILTRNLSPAAPEAHLLYVIPPSHGLDPAIALAFFHHESGYGLHGIALATRNWGNLRRGQGRSIGMLHNFATYRNWVDSLYDWCLLIKNVYIAQRKLTMVRQVLPIYAPSSDGNAPGRYADSVMADVARWRSEDGMVVESGTHYKVKANVTAPVIVRSAARQNAAVIKRLKAGDDWWGVEVPGVAATVKGFGTSSTWVKDAEGRYVWRNLLEEVNAE